MDYLKKCFCILFIGLLASAGANAAGGIAQEDCNASLRDLDVAAQITKLQKSSGGYDLSINLSNLSANNYEITGLEPDGCKAANMDVTIKSGAAQTISYLCDSTFNPNRVRVTAYARDLAADPYSPAMLVCSVVVK